ncbi:hypothetical protein HYH03_018490, partial [Edaphochlamys debaryana]
LSAERLSRLVVYSFYKNLAYGGSLLLFQFYCGFSGQALIDDISGSFYNVVFTAFPVLVAALQESSAPRPASTLLAHPSLYNARPHLTAPRFWAEGVGLALLHSAACFFIPLYSASPRGTLPLHGLWAVGKTVLVCLVSVVNAELLLTTRSWTRLLGWAVGLSIALPFPVLLLVWRLELASGYVDESSVGVADVLFASSYFWCCLAGVLGLTVGTRYLERAVRWLFLPDPLMGLARQDAARTARERKEGAARTTRRGAGSGGAAREGQGAKPVVEGAGAGGARGPDGGGGGGGAGEA